MSPEERQLVQGLFDRMRTNANSQRDAEAEQLIADNVRQQPYAPYLLAQTVLVQDQALQAANARLEQLEEQVRDQGRQSGGGGFLSGLFGGGARPSAPPPVPVQRPVWNQGSTYQQPSYAPPPPQGGPWGGGGPQMGMGGGGGFMQGAMQTAAGVAGGVLLADGIRSLFGSHNNPMGITSGVPGFGGGSTVTNNYYGDSSQTAADYQQDMQQDADDNAQQAADWQQDADQDQDDAQDAADFGGDSYDT